MISKIPKIEEFQNILGLVSEMSDCKCDGQTIDGTQLFEVRYCDVRAPLACKAYLHNREVQVSLLIGDAKSSLLIDNVF